MNNEVYILDCTHLSDETQFDKAYELVSYDRAREIEQLHFKEDQLLSLGVDLLTQYLCKKYQIVDEVKHDEDGKPHLYNSKQYISISHCYPYALVGLSEEPIGVDAEKITNQYETVLKHFYRDDEKEFVQNHTDSASAFYELWSRKESYIKVHGAIDIRKFSTLELDEGYNYHSYPLEGYSCVAYTSNKKETSFTEVSLEDILDNL